MVDDDGDVSRVEHGVDDAAEAFRAARALREHAEQAAAEIKRAAEAEADLLKSDAQRFASRRLHEIELYVGKAKRGLAAAEQRADVILSTARAEAERLLLVARQEAGELLERRAADEARAGATTSLPDDTPRDPLASELDRMLADALAKALDLPRDEPYPLRRTHRER